MRSVTTAAVTGMLVLVARPAPGEEIVHSIDWQRLDARQALSAGTLVPGSGDTAGASLRVVNERDEAKTFHLVTIHHPEVTTSRYALRGHIRYEGITAPGYLEMWSHLPDGAFFTRSLETRGPLARIEGSSPWREFVLPFFNQDGAPPPQQLVLNVVLPGAGTVDVGPIELVQFAAGEDVFAVTGAWWTERQAGLVGGVVGSAMGLFGAAIGWLGSTGRARGFVLGGLRIMAMVGLIALGLAGYALLTGQPYAVYYPLGLIGAISSALGLTLPRSVARRYEELELRRMHALDA